MTTTDTRSPLTEGEQRLAEELEFALKHAMLAFFRSASGGIDVQRFSKSLDLGVEVATSEGKHVAASMLMRMGELPALIAATEQQLSGRGDPTH